MAIEYRIFELLMKEKAISEKEYLAYSKIPEKDIREWQEKDRVPPFAFVILRDMGYRRALDRELRNRKRTRKYPLTDKERKRIEAAFWGTCYCADEILDRVREGEPGFLERFMENTPEEIREKVFRILS